MGTMITYQDYERAENKTKWLQSALVQYTGSKEYKDAIMQTEYMAGRDTEIINTVKVIYDMTGQAVEDFTATNNRISSNIFHRLISDRCSYSLGNGISFPSAKQERGPDNKMHTVDTVKDALGDRFDNVMYRAAYWAQGNGASYTYVHKGHRKEQWEFDLFKKTEFLALYDEMTGALRGGIRFWTLDRKDKTRPIIAVLYTEQGYQRFQTPDKQYGYAALEPVTDMTPYEETVQVSEADGVEVIGGINYPMLPIVALYPNEMRVSALDNMKAKIDALDLVLSGFANDMHDCAEIYWLVNGGMGMDENDKKEIRDRLLLQHMAVIDAENSSITPYTQEPPYQARETFIQRLIDRIYADFGDVNVTQISSQQRTATEIEAAYQPMDQEADTFEYQVIEYVQGILSVIGLDGVPQFKRSKISNIREQTEMVMLAAEVLDTETILRKLPWITVDEVEDILARKDVESDKRFETQQESQNKTQPDGNEE